jgi:hypothetical protein
VKEGGHSSHNLAPGFQGSSLVQLRGSKMKLSESEKVKEEAQEQQWETLKGKDSSTRILGWE